MTRVETSRVSRKGLTTIPSAVRRAAGIEEGDTLVWEVRGSGEIVVRVRRDSYGRVRGKYSDPRLTYRRLEGEADRLLEAEADAAGGAGHADSPS